MNVIHVVRASSRGVTVTHAQASNVRTATLQRFSIGDAHAAGFHSEDEFFTWWRRRYATGPLMSDPVRCWVVEYLRVDIEIPQFVGLHGS